MKKKYKKQFCVNGHDTFICGRDFTRGCRECRKERDRKRSKKNRVKIQIQHRKYYRKNKKRLNKTNAVYRLKHPDKYFVYYRKIGTRFSHSKSYARKLNYKWEITLEEYTYLLSNPCYYCKFSLANEMGVGLDRIDNDKTVGYILSNVLSCCGLCNITRSNNFSVEEMLLLGKVIRKIKKSHAS